MSRECVSERDVPHLGTVTLVGFDDRVCLVDAGDARAHALGAEAVLLRDSRRVNVIAAGRAGLVGGCHGFVCAGSDDLTCADRGNGAHGEEEDGNDRVCLHDGG